MSRARMPWHETDPVKERMRFVVAVDRGDLSMAEACRQHGISRKTGYKILTRYPRDGPESLRDQSRAPHSRPNQTPPETDAAILRIRKAHPTWGSKKILATLMREQPGGSWPVRSTIDAVLKRAGVVSARRRRRRGTQPSSQPLVEAVAPNDVWSINYKGWFRVGDGTRCDPLTVNDAASRASLVCQAMVSPKLDDVKLRLEDAFWQFGRPRYLLSDNGPPFASSGLARLSRLGVWLLRLDIQPVFIDPGRPDQNGRHERFHETLKAETASPPKATMAAQQRSFGSFQVIYNESRPHEALDMRVPAEVYEFSDRAMLRALPEHEYPEGFEARRVRPDGSIKWGGKSAFVGQAFQGEVIALERVEDGLQRVHLGSMPIGMLHERSRTITPVESDESSVAHVPGQRCYPCPGLHIAGQSSLAEDVLANSSLPAARSLQPSSRRPRSSSVSAARTIFRGRSNEISSITKSPVALWVAVRSGQKIARDCHGEPCVLCAGGPEGLWHAA